MKRTLLLLLVATVALTLSLGASAASSPSAKLLIHHQLRGCHAWSLNGSKFQVSQSVSLKRGGFFTVTNNDVMSHQLLKLSGASVAMTLTNPGTATTGKLKPPYAAGLMPHMGAVLKVSFAKAGVYTFTTKEGADYIPGVKTLGPDNVLKLRVVVA
jgi:hypothetical protein